MLKTSNSSCLMFFTLLLTPYSFPNLAHHQIVPISHSKCLVQDRTDLSDDWCLQYLLQWKVRSAPKHTENNHMASSNRCSGISALEFEFDTYPWKSMEVFRNRNQGHTHFLLFRSHGSHLFSDVWCVMCDVWCVMCDVWCRGTQSIPFLDIWDINSYQT